MMRYGYALLAALCLPVSAAAAPPPFDAISQQIVQANDAVQRATQQHDVATMERLITPDYYLVGPNGHVYNRADFIDDIADTSATYEINQTEDARVQHYNDDIALLTAVLHVRYRVAAKVVDVRVRYTDTWVKLDGQWRYAAGQATTLKKPA
jgi:ketosteroid isomerase-like protein